MIGSNPQRLVAEVLGTAFLLVAVVGPGIVTSSDAAVSTQLFQHAIAVGLALSALIATFGPVSGAHFNPVVTVVDALFGGLSARLAAAYVAAQAVGAVLATTLIAWLLRPGPPDAAEEEPTGDAS